MSSPCRRITQIATTVFALAIATPLSAKPPGFAQNNPTFYGVPGFIGNGAIRTYVETDHSGIPISVGVEFDATLLDNLPTSPSDGAWDILDEDGNVVWHCCGHEVELFFHDAVANLIPFEHFVLNWNPAGHVPPRVYDTPHFDLHFYTITSEARHSIEAPSAEDACRISDFSPVTCDDLAFLTLPLPSDQQPPNHTSVAAVEPGMGNHLLDFGSAEWNDAPFTHTWIFGTMGGNLSFWEPMITREYFLWLQSLSPSRKKSASDPNGGALSIKGHGASVNVPFASPSAAPEAGLYPTSYSVEYLKPNDTFRVGLEDLIYLPQSSGVE